jgi:hypothetical protein
VTQEDFVLRLTRRLEEVGSLASSLHGRAYSTQDAGLVTDPSPQQLDHLLRCIETEVGLKPPAGTPKRDTPSARG